MGLVIESNVTPPIAILNGAEPGPFASYLQPTVRGDFAGLPIAWAPYGAAQGFGSIVFYGVLLLAAVGAWSLVRGIKKGR